MRPSAILFDMDGTLTRPMLDFAAIRAEMGIGDRPILEAMAEMEPARLARARQILLRHEDAAAAQSTLNPGCAELLRWIESRRIPVALITRNSRRSAEIVVARHALPIRILITRDDGAYKPDPAPLLLACRRLAVPNHHDAWMVGDGPHDVEAGLAAGMKTVWISHRRQRDFRALPWKTVADPHELHELLQQIQW